MTGLCCDQQLLSTVVELSGQESAMADKLRFVAERFVQHGYHTPHIGHPALICTSWHLCLALERTSAIPQNDSKQGYPPSRVASSTRDL